MMGIGMAVRPPRSRGPVLMMISALRRLGGTLFYAPDNALGDGAPNLLSSPEFANGVTDAPVRGGLVTASTLAGYDGAIAFGHDGITASYAYKGFTYTNGLTYTLSVIVKMDDGNAPTFAAVNDGTHSTNSFAVVVGGAVINPTLLTSVAQPDGTYRISGTWVSVGVGTNTGIIKYASNNSRTFKVTGYKLELGSTATAYTPQAVLRQRGVYVDSVGTTPVTAYADLLGLTTDRLGVLGVELVTNGDFSAGTAGWNATSATISTVGGELSVLASSTAQPSAAQAISTVSGKTYKISARLRADAANTVAKSARVRVAETASGGLIYSGPYEVTSNGVARELTAFFTAPIATVYVLLEVGSSSAYGNVGDKAYFDNLSVREVPGNHATQSAVASKPSVQRVPKRLGPNLVVNGGFDNGTTGWTALGGATLAVVSGELQTTSTTSAGSTGARQVLTGLTVGRAYQIGGGFRVISTGSGETNSLSIRWAAGDVTSGFTALGGSGNTTSSTPVVPVSAQFVATSTTVTIALINGGSGATTSTYIQGADNIAVQEVLEWANVISFDGSNDFLQTGITTGNEGWVCAGVAHNVAATAIVFSSGGENATQAGAALRMAGGPTGYQLMLSDGVTGQVIQSSVTTVAPGTPFVYEGGWDASTRLVGVDGAITSAAKTINCTSSLQSRIGGSVSGGLPLNGPMHAIAYTPVLPSAADRATIRNGIAAMQGRTL